MLRSNNATERSMRGVGMRSIEVFDLLRDTGKHVVAPCVRSIEVFHCSILADESFPPFLRSSSHSIINEF